MGRASRKMLAWHLSNTIDAAFCVDALTRFGESDISNMDQGSQFTGTDIISMLRGTEVHIVMDGRGRWMDNVFIDRLWRSLKYECAYPNAFRTGAGLGRWIDYYKGHRPYARFSGQTTDDVYKQASYPDHARI